MKTEEIKETQEKLLALLPLWNYRIAKPFKQLLDEGISLEMYYFLQTLRWLGGTMVMSELAPYVQMQKQQMTKIVNRLVELEFIKRIYDTTDRRMIKLQITDKALEYIDYFLKEDAGCFRQMLEGMNETELCDFKKAMDILIRVLPELPCDRKETVRQEE